MVAVTKTLYLLRHAKSDWSDGRLADHDRPLAPRGERDTSRMGSFIAQIRPRPSLVLCSSAKRARQTWTEIAAALDEPIELHVEEDLYGASDIDLLARVGRLPESVDSAVLVGHNPGMQDLAIELAGGGDEDAMRRLAEKFPTCALASLTVEGAWKDVVPGSCRLKLLVTPKQLPD